MKKIMSVSAALLTASTVVSAQAPSYPAAPKDGSTDEYFGTVVPDPFRPLEDDNSPATEAWVAAENAVTDAYLAKIPQRRKIKERLREVVNYERIGIPFFQGGKWYVYKNNGLQNQSVLYQMDTPDGEQRVFLDPNTLSDDGTVALKGVYFSNNGKYVAYAVSRSGSDWEEIYVRDMKTGRLLDDHIMWAKFTGAAWRGDGFYYSAYDAPAEGEALSGKNEVHKIYYHKVGTPQSDDILFFQNPCFPLRFYDVSVNEEETVMMLYESGEGSGNNLFVRDLRVPDSRFVQMTRDMDQTYSPVETIGDSIFLLTNYGAPKNRLMVATLQKPAVTDWKEVVPETQDLLENVSFVGGKMILSYAKDACSHAYVCGADGAGRREIAFPTVGSASVYGRRDRNECFYSFSSFTVPGAVYSYDLASGESAVWSSPKVKFDAGAYESRQVFIVSKDGTKVPLFITHKKGLKLNGKNPLLLYGYGGFNISMPPYFSAYRIPFLESGGVYAQACLRGGSEYGEEWHQAGTKMRKQNVFDDFIAAAEWLIDNKYTSSEHLAIMGGSNGGLLVGACMTQRPDLFKVCIPQVGVMDMLRYHKFTIGWNWAPDYGTSEDSPEMFQYLKGYSPLHNLRKGVKYPATLVTTADHDDRVVPAHSFKFAATLQECQSGDAPVLIRIDSKAGHGGGKPVEKVIEEYADIYGFIMSNMGMKVRR